MLNGCTLTSIPGRLEQALSWRGRAWTAAHVDCCHGSAAKLGVDDLSGLGVTGLESLSAAAALQAILLTLLC